MASSKAPRKPGRSTKARPRRPIAAGRVYDLIFNLPFHPGRTAAARAANAAAPNGEMLVVGVGTGLELGLLSHNARITGIDLSEPMLKVARERVARLGLSM